MKTSKFILLVAFAIGGLGLALVLQRRAEANIRQNEKSLRQQQAEINRQIAEDQNLSKRIAQTDRTTITNGSIADYAAELVALHAKAAALRSQEVQLSNEQWSVRLAAGIHLLSDGNSNLLDHNKTLEMSMAGGPRPNSGKIGDARSIAAAVRAYAREHEGLFPTSLGQVTAYLPPSLDSNSPSWLNAPVSGTNNFEIIYQGVTNDLGNIPARRVALLRERQPWLTADGKWARAYAYADGAAEIVVSDDNFQSWDAVHVVPPPTNP